MENARSLALQRDCDAVLIPAGNPVILPAGTAVTITQNLGGTFTVQTPGGLFRIAARDADALGLQPQPAEETAPTQDSPAAPIDEQQVWEILRTCYDPEIPVNIVDLGLVYDLHLEPLPSGLHKVNVKMTLTAPGCGMGPAIASDAQQKLLTLPGAEDAQVEIVWDPPWHHSMISPAGRAKLGLD
jgi:probable FeS assembly SUF system protein SufT